MGYKKGGKQTMRTLVLNADYTAHQVIGSKSALRLMYMNQADPKTGAIAIEYHPGVYMIDTRGREHPIPSIITLAKYRPKNKQIPFSKKNIFIRDSLICQYCGFVGNSPTEMSLDHVIPRAIWRKQKMAGTPTNWTNIVTCCKPCNCKKADKPLKDSGMRLINTPGPPTNPHNFIIGLSPWSKKEHGWLTYLPPLYSTFGNKDIVDAADKP